MRHLIRHILILLAAVLLAGLWPFSLKEAVAQEASYRAAIVESGKILASNPNDFNALMVLGDAYLNLKNGSEAVAALEKAHRLDPESLRAAPNLGLAYMMTGDYGKAIGTWQAFTKKYPDSRMSARLKKQTTVLLHLDAARWARESVKQEKILQPSSLDENVVAVAPFGDRGLADDAKPLRKAIAAMTITDLSKVKNIRVVERLKLQKLLDELRFGASGIVDEKTAPRLGQLLGAGRIVTGSMASAGKDDVRIVRILRSVAKEEDSGRQDAQGKLNDFFKMQKSIVFGILKNMGIKLTGDEEALIGKYATQSFQAVKFYGEALDAEDRGNWSEAARLYGLCAAEDPGSPLAEIVKYIPTGAEATTDVGRIKASIIAAAAMDAIPIQKMSAEYETAGAASLAAGSDFTSLVMVATSTDSTAPPPDSSTVVQNQNTQGQDRPTTHYGFTVAQLMQDASGTVDYTIYSINSILNFDPSYYKTTAPTMTIEGLTGSSPVLTQLQVNDGGIQDITIGLPASVTRVELGYNSYIEWGYWTQSSSMDWPSSDGPYYFDSPNYYVWGDPTSDANMATLKANNVTGTYAGTAYGTWSQGGGASNSASMSGSFRTSVNFGAGTLSGFNVSVAGAGHSASIADALGTFSGGTSLFSINNATGTWTIDGAQATSASANGSVYGNSAQAIGGQWTMQVDSDVFHVQNATGIFQGKR